MNGEKILQNILDNPSDPLPRLIYADWLEEHGDPGLAPRVAAMRGSKEPWPVTELCPEIGRLIEAVLDGCGRYDVWCEGRKVRRGGSIDLYPDTRSTIVVRGGFLAHLEVPLTAWLREGKSVGPRHPLSLEITDMRPAGVVDSNACYWHCSSDHAIPPEIFRHLPDTGSMANCVFYGEGNVRLAKEALARACLLFSREVDF